MLGIPVFNVPYHQKLLGEECDAYMGLADIHQYAPSRYALHESDVVIMVGARLDTNRQKRGEWVEQTIAGIVQLNDDRIHPLQLALDVQTAPHLAVLTH